MATQIDLGAVVPIGKGDWNIDTTYERTNIVRHNSAAWVCKVNTSIGVEPSEDSSDWYLLTKDTSSVTSVNGQKGDVTINIETIETPEENDVSNKIVNTEWVNNKITPIKSELSSTTSIAEDAKSIATLANSTANTALTNANNALSDLDNYLPLTGGTITGNLGSSWNNKLTGNIRSDHNTYFLTAVNDSGTNGGSVVLRTERYTDSPNGVELYTGTNFTGPILQLQQNGNCLWNGKHIVRTVNGIIADANGNISLPLQYLPINGSYALNTPEEFGIGVGTSWNNAPSFTLYSTERTDGNQGRFSIRAKSNSSNMNELVGNPSGQLTWAGQNIVRHINGIYADAGGGVDVINNVKVKNAGYADNAGYANSAGSASMSYICTGVVVLSRVTSATLPNYGTWAWLCIGYPSTSRSGNSAGGTRIYYDSNNENPVSVIAIRIG